MKGDIIMKGGLHHEGGGGGGNWGMSYIVQVHSIEI